MDALDILKCSGPSFPAGFSTSKTWRLTVSFMAFPPLDVAVLDAVDVHETRNRTHCALRTTLVGRRSSRNGNIVANTATVEACCVGPEICQTRRGRNLRG
jgi:hypothetical protein